MSNPWLLWPYVLGGALTAMGLDLGLNYFIPARWYWAVLYGLAAAVPWSALAIDRLRPCRLYTNPNMKPGTRPDRKPFAGLKPSSYIFTAYANGLCAVSSMYSMRWSGSWNWLLLLSSCLCCLGAFLALLTPLFPWNTREYFRRRVAEEARQYILATYARLHIDRIN